jgi:hypothetical protein
MELLSRVLPLLALDERGHLHHGLLALLMGSTDQDGVPSARYKFVNFQKSKQPRVLDYQPQTVEFRQHHGSLDAAEIGRWACFLMALMGAAEKRAKADHTAAFADQNRPGSARSVDQADA